MGLKGDFKMDEELLQTISKSLTHLVYKNTIVEDLHAEGANLDDKTTPAILWASTIYAFVKENRGHLGIEVFADPLERATVCAIRNREVNNVSINQLRSEMVSIFENTELESEVYQYMAKAWIRNEDYLAQDSLLDPTWYDFKTLEPLDLQIENISINNDEDLINALQSASEANYVAGLEYITNTYLSEDSTFEQIFKSNIIIGTIASRLINDGKIDQNAEQLNNIAYNITMKALSAENMLESAIKNTNYLLPLNRNYSESLLQIINDAYATADQIYRQNEQITEYEPLIVADESLIDNQETKTVSGILKTQKPRYQVSRKKTISQYISYFKDDLIPAKLAEFDGFIEKLEALLDRKSFSSKDKALVENIAKSLNMSFQLAPMTNNLSALQDNAEQLLVSIISLQDSLSALVVKGRAIDKISKKNKDNLDIQNQAFDKKLLGKIRVSKNNENLIKGYYSLLSDILKESQSTCRMATKPFIEAELYHAMQTNTSDETAFLRFFFMGTIKDPAKKTLAQLTAYKLFINEDGTENEEFKELYEKIADSKASIHEKQEAFIMATANNEVSKEDQDVIDKYIKELQEKEAVKKEKEEKRIADEEQKAKADAEGYDVKTGQYSMDIAISEKAESEEENENE